MKRMLHHFSALSVAALIFFTSAGLRAQVTTNGGSGLAATYPSLAAAITALNSASITSPVVITLSGNETAPAGGYVITASGNAANTIIIHGSSSTITAPNPQPSGSLNDAIFKIIGGDFITIRNFTMQENPSNTTNTPASSNNMTEFGIALFYASATNGCQHITIHNNTISLNRNYTNTFGIYANSTHSAMATGTPATATGANGGNHNLTITGNTISNVNQGIVVVGPIESEDQNTGLVIGGSVANANIISNFGTAPQLTNYANVSATMNGVLVRNSNGYSITHNSITSSAGGVTTGTLRGIFHHANSNAPTHTFTNNVTYNTISVQGGAAGVNIANIVLDETCASATSSLNFDNNAIINLNHTVSANTGVVALSNSSAHKHVSISNNTFNNLTSNTSGNFTFISASYITPVDGTKTINNNSIVTGFTKSVAGGTVWLYGDSGLSNTGTSIQNNNNNFSNITLTGGTNISGWFNGNGVGDFPQKTITGNTFENWACGTGTVTVLHTDYGNLVQMTGNTINNISGSGKITGLLVGTSGTYSVAANVLNNTITHLTSIGTGGDVTGISFGAASPTTGIHNVAHNIISNLSSTGTMSTVVGITSSSPGVNISNNTIHTLSGLASNSGATNGIMITSFTPGTIVNIFKNKIYNIQSTGAFTNQAGVNGIVCSGFPSPATISIFNNLVGDLKAPNANSVDAIRGISVTATGAASNYNISYNSVYIAASSFATNFGTTGIFHTARTTTTTASLTLRNNLIVNNSTASGTGLVIAFRRSAGGLDYLNNYNLASNYNCFYAGTPGPSNLIYSDGTSVAQTIDQYKNGVFTAGTVAPRDSQSFTENPAFVSVLGSDADFLKVSTTVPTQLESGGITIEGITDDYAGVLRYPNPGYPDNPSSPATAPDVGAYEFGGLLLDVTPPVIAFTPLPNTATLTVRTLIASITDKNGVPTSGSGLPVLYWSINSATGPFTAATATHMSGSDYQFSFGSGVTLGDVVYYYIAAQDLGPIPNVSVNPSTGAGGFTINPPAAATPPTNPASYEITLPISGGDYKVGPGGDYATLTAAITDLNRRGLTGAIRFLLTHSTYSADETFPIRLNINNTALPTSANTITIKPDTSVVATISGIAGFNPLIEIRNSYVRIDGSNTAAGTTRDLTIENTSPYSPQAIMIGSTGTTPIVGSGILNSNIMINGSIVVGIMAVAVYSSDRTAGYFNDITIQNNDIRRGFSGIHCHAVVAEGNGSGLLIDGNLLNAAGTDAISSIGIYVQGVDGATVSNNTIANFFGLNEWNDMGIYLAAGTRNTTISRNLIHSLKYTGTGGYGAYGIHISTGVTDANITMANNVIYDISGDGHSYTGAYVYHNPFGILLSSSQTGINIYNNSIHLFGNTLNQSNAISAGIGLLSGSVADIRNNVIVNNLGRLSATGYGAIGVFAQTSNTQFANINYNDYWVNPTGTGVKAVGQIGTTASTSLSGWQTATGQDANSFSADPLFTTSTDLRPQAGSPVLFAGTPLSAVTTDFNGDARNNPPSMGAYEYETGSTGPVVLYGAQDAASNYSSWTDGSNGGAGFGAWTLTANAGSGFAGHFMANPAGAGITGMDNPSFGLYANPGGSGAFATADRPFITPLPVGATFSFDWGVNWDSDVPGGNKGFNLYTGGTGATEIINVNMANSAAITINGNPMFNNYGTQKMTLNFEYVSAGNLRVYGTGRDGSETYDQVIPVAGAPDAIRFYASGMNGGSNREPYFNNLQVTTLTSAIASTSTVQVIGNVLLNDSLTAGNMLIGAGHALRLGPTNQLSINGTLVNSAGTSGLVIRSNNTGTGSLLHNTGNVPATIERYMLGGGYHTVSVPLTQSSNPVTGMFLNSNLFRFDENLNDYVSMGDLSTTPLDVNKGYRMWYTGSTTTYSLAGNLNNGAFTAATSYSGATKGWNLVPNPYPSPIDWDAASGWTKTNLNDAVYVFNRAIAGSPSSPHGQWASYVDGVGTNGGTNIIRTGQSFFVRASAAWPVLTMNNSVRTHGNSNILKNNGLIPDILRIMATTAAGTDEAVVRLRDGSTTGFDGQFDAYKMPGSASLPQLYSMSSDNQKLSINAVPSSQTVMVPLAFQWQNNGEVSLSFSELESFEADRAIYLEDVLTGEMRNLRQNPVYTFNHTEGLPELRFRLHFNEVVSVGELDGSNARIWSHNARIYVSIPDASGNRARIELFDVLGNCLMDINRNIDNPTIIHPAVRGVVIVRVTEANRVHTQKLFLR
ncbi:MAG TPA: right-handed parallel beta-helix repeat-containing protein [Bacteroidales bacterium]|nr:right-handed parallel beta-helix repeat-containing protein [Bacteroidales bacterium]